MDRDLVTALLAIALGGMAFIAACSIFGNGYGTGYREAIHQCLPDMEE